MGIKVDKNKRNSPTVVRKNLAKLYGHVCMLTGIKINEKNGIYDNFITKGSMHHILKEADNGPDTVENGALINTSSHQWLHCILELRHIDIYDKINILLKKYKKAMDEHDVEFIRLYEEQIQPFIYNEVLKYTIRPGSYQLGYAPKSAMFQLSQKNINDMLETCYITDIYFNDSKLEIFYNNDIRKRKKGQYMNVVYEYELWDTSAKLNTNIVHEPITEDTYEDILDNLEKIFKTKLSYREEFINIFDEEELQQNIKVTQLVKEYFDYLLEIEENDKFKVLMLYLKIIQFYELVEQTELYSEHKDNLKTSMQNDLDKFLSMKLYRRLNELNMCLDEGTLSSIEVKNTFKEIKKIQALIYEIEKKDHLIYEMYKK